MIPNGACFLFIAGFTDKLCPCGGVWDIHCKHPNCKWVICTSGNHLAVLDYKNKRLWGIVPTAA